MGIDRRSHGIGSYIKICFLALILMSVSWCVDATMCPDPSSSSLQSGSIPLPWVLNPFSAHEPQHHDEATFFRANLLVLGFTGRGVICTYQNRAGYYSIWWEVPVRKPVDASEDWQRTASGFECSTSLVVCTFYQKYTNFNQ